jgi:hypothetical protein
VASRYLSALNGSATLELDVNYMARHPLSGAPTWMPFCLANCGRTKFSSSTPMKSLPASSSRLSTGTPRAICLPRDRVAAKGDVDAWIRETIALCREKFGFLFDLTSNEREFVDGVLDRGEIHDDLLDMAPEIGVRTGVMRMFA